MFRLVIPLPFNLILVHKRAFQDRDAAYAYMDEHYEPFPCVEVWRTVDVCAWPGTIINFPFGGDSNA